MKRVRLGAIAVTALLVVAACGEGTATSAPAASTAGSQAPGASDATSPAAGGSITFWTAEDNAERVAATQAIVDRFTAASGIDVEVVAIAEDQLQAQITAASAAGTLPDVYGALSLGFVHSLAADGLANTDASQAVVDTLGAETFSPRSLELVTVDGKLIGVPSDSWAQMLVYRKDLFENAGLLHRRPTRPSWPPRRRSTRTASPASSPQPVPPTRSRSRRSSTSRSQMAAS